MNYHNLSVIIKRDNNKFFLAIPELLLLTEDASLEKAYEKLEKEKDNLLKKFPSLFSSAIDCKKTRSGLKSHLPKFDRLEQLLKIITLSLVSLVCIVFLSVLLTISFVLPAIKPRLEDRIHNAIMTNEKRVDSLIKSNIDYSLSKTQKNLNSANPTNK